MDTLKTAKRLQKQGLSQEVSEELTEILSEFESSDLASKQDLKELEYSLKQDLAKLQKEIHDTSLATVKWVAGFLVGQTALLFTLIKLFG